MRNGTKFGPATMVDGLQKDVLVDAYDTMQWEFALTYVLLNNFSREDQDNYAIQSYERSAKAGKLVNLIEIVPVVSTKKRRSNYHF
jgi:acetyl-CoA C-acetyltransferase